MKIAIFADIHGKVLLPFKMVDLFQQQYGEKIDLILQCGDMGAFPNYDKLDKATIRHAGRDGQELGFMDMFVTKNNKIQSFLDYLNIDMVCVRGNHEDHDYLDQLELESRESKFPIDHYKRVFVCKSGAYQTFAKDNDTLTFMGIGRIGDWKGRDHSRFIQDYERKNIRQSLKQAQKLDVLISHDVSSEMTTPEFGMDELRSVLDRLKPVAHFYGHTGQPYSMERDQNGYTQSVKIKELEFNKSGMLDDGCMLVLKKEGFNYDLQVVERKFLNQFMRDSWMSI